MRLTTALLDATLILTLLLALAALALSPPLAPVRRAFLSPPPALVLAPGEVLLAEFRPDRRVSRLLALFVPLTAAAAALAGQALLGAAPAAAWATLAPFTAAGLAWMHGESRARWHLTDRRVVTGLGASLPLADIGRIAIGPTLLRLDGRGAQSLRLVGLADPQAAALAIRQALHGSARRQ